MKKVFRGRLQLTTHVVAWKCSISLSKVCNYGRVQLIYSRLSHGKRLVGMEYRSSSACCSNTILSLKVGGNAFGQWFCFLTCSWRSSHLALSWISSNLATAQCRHISTSLLSSKQGTATNGSPIRTNKKLLYRYSGLILCNPRSRACLFPSLDVSLLVMERHWQMSVSPCHSTQAQHLEAAPSPEWFH